MKKRYWLAYILCSWLFGLFVLLPAQAAKGDSQRSYDIYLTHQRVCRQCTWRVLTNQAGEPTGQVELSNLYGEQGIYRQDEIIGVNNHPFWRKFLLKSLKGNELPSRTIAPWAYDPEDKPYTEPDWP